MSDFDLNLVTASISPSIQEYESYMPSPPLHLLSTLVAKDHAHPHNLCLSWLYSLPVACSPVSPPALLSYSFGLRPSRGANITRRIIGASLSEPHTSELVLKNLLRYMCTLRLVFLAGSNFSEFSGRGPNR